MIIAFFQNAVEVVTDIHDLLGNPCAVLRHFVNGAYITPTAMRAALSALLACFRKLTFQRHAPIFHGFQLDGQHANLLVLAVSIQIDLFLSFLLLFLHGLTGIPHLLGKSVGLFLEGGKAFLHAETLLAPARAYLPFFSYGMGWVLPACLGLVIGLAVHFTGKKAAS